MANGGIYSGKKEKEKKACVVENGHGFIECLVCPYLEVKADASTRGEASMKKTKQQQVGPTN